MRVGEKNISIFLLPKNMCSAMFDAMSFPATQLPSELQTSGKLLALLAGRASYHKSIPMLDSLLLQWVLGTFSGLAFFFFSLSLLRAFLLEIFW